MFIPIGLLPLPFPGGADRDVLSSPAQTPTHGTTKSDNTFLSFPLKSLKDLELFLLVGLDFSMDVYRGRRVRREWRYLAVWKSGAEFSNEFCQYHQMQLKVEK